MPVSFSGLIILVAPIFMRISVEVLLFAFATIFGTPNLLQCITAKILASKLLPVATTTTSQSLIPISSST